MKILVTGAAGQLGYDVCRILSDRGIEAIGVDRAEFDLTDPKATRDFLLAAAPDAIIHCAAYTAVDRAEDEPELCEAINVKGTSYVAAAARELGVKMLYISTDYVFDGLGEDFYQSDRPAAPVSVYGKTKFGGEEAVRALVDKHFIVRISWAFGIHGKNFVRTMLKLSETKTDLNVVCDQIGSPTYTYDLSKLLCDMIVSEKYGTYHATNEGICSWAEFAAAIMELAGKNTVIHPIPSSEYPAKARRPLNSRMDKSKLEAAGFSRLPHWKDALVRYLSELAEEENANTRA